MRCGSEASALGFCFSLSEKAISLTEFGFSSAEMPFPRRDFAFPRRKSDFRIGILLFPGGEALPLPAFHIFLSEKANSSVELLISVREKRFPCGNFAFPWRRSPSLPGISHFLVGKSEFLSGIAHFREGKAIFRAAAGKV